MKLATGNVISRGSLTTTNREPKKSNCKDLREMARGNKATGHF